MPIHAWSLTSEQEKELCARLGLKAENVVYLNFTLEPHQPTFVTVKMTVEPEVARSVFGWPADGQ